jgi:mRNA interferase HigB
VRLFSQRPLKQFWQVHPDAETSLRFWITVVKAAKWKHFADVKKVFGSADQVGKYTVFNIGGNKYRLITVINYKWQVAYVRAILTHADYDQDKWKTS